MKTKILWLIVLISTVMVSKPAIASLITIGKAHYGDNYYNLIYDDDNNGNGLVWLDYSNSPKTPEGYEGYPGWQHQVDWATSLKNPSILECILNPDILIKWDGLWRLPKTVDGETIWGYEGDPDRDGIYTYTNGYNIANSEMGHLFYSELGNLGYFDTSGNYRESGVGLLNVDNFDNLNGDVGYWSGTTQAVGIEVDHAWVFGMPNGYQFEAGKKNTYWGIAVRSGNIIKPIPEPSTLLLLIAGLVGLAGITRRKLKK